MKTEDFYRICIRQELAYRCDRNHRYSLRAFAKSLGSDVSAVSRVLSGQQIPSQKLANKFIEACDLSATDRERFVQSLRRKRTKLSKIIPNEESNPAKELDAEYHRVISDWYHLTILELTNTKNFDSRPSWISSQLGISMTEAQLAVERLLHLGLLSEHNGRLVKTSKQLTTANKNISTPALRQNQRKLLEKAIQSLDNDPIEARSITSMCMAIDLENFTEARRLISEFNRAMSALLETANQTQVYNLQIALYPLQRS